MSDQPQSNEARTPAPEAAAETAAASDAAVDPISGLTSDEMNAAVKAVLDTDAPTAEPPEPADGASPGQPPAPSAGAPEPLEQRSAARTTSDGRGATSPSGRPFGEPELAPTAGRGDLATIELLDDVELDVKVELGRTEMYIEDVLRLGVGSVVELDRAAGDPVDIRVNDRLVARGEVLVLNDSFCVRINEIVSPVPETQGEAG